MNTEKPITTSKKHTLRDGSTVAITSTRYADGRLSHNYTREELRTAYQRADRRKTPLDLVALDEMLDLKNEYGENLIGLPVNWHGHRGVVEQFGKNKLGVRVRIPCDNKCGRRITLHVFSGVHTGAFCIVRDKEGKYLADLRDVNSFCQHCAKQDRKN